MQNEQTLLKLGFKHHPEWDFEEIGAKHYRKEISGKVFRAYEVNFNGPTSYVSLGEVITPDGKVKRWRDCCSSGSVARKINSSAPVSVSTHRNS